MCRRSHRSCEQRMYGHSILFALECSVRFLTAHRGDDYSILLGSLDRLCISCPLSMQNSANGRGDSARPPDAPNLLLHLRACLYLLKMGINTVHPLCLRRHLLSTHVSCVCHNGPLVDSRDRLTHPRISTAECSRSHQSCLRLHRTALRELSGHGGLVLRHSLFFLQALSQSPNRSCLLLLYFSFLVQSSRPPPSRQYRRLKHLVKRSARIQYASAAGVQHNQHCR